MISSGIARLSSKGGDFADVLAQLSAHPAIEVGELVNQSSLPLTIEAGSPDELERIHDWIRGLPGIEFMDVVFVFLQDESATATNCEHGMSNE